MAVSVTMPRLGESVSEGTVTRWLKSEGDRVEADEPLLEVSTDKVDTEIPSPAGGVLKTIKVGEDETVEVGSELAVIDDGAGGEIAVPAEIFCPGVQDQIDPIFGRTLVDRSAERAIDGADQPMVASDLRRLAQVDYAQRRIGRRLKI